MQDLVNCLICGNQIIKPLKVRAGCFNEKKRKNGKQKEAMTSLPTANKGDDVISKWEISLLESLSMLFGLPVNHHVVYETFSGVCHKRGEGLDRHEQQQDKKLQLRLQMCNRCLEDVSEVHSIFWQLSKLEKKLVHLQGLNYERLRGNYEREKGSGIDVSVLDDTLSLTTETIIKTEAEKLFHEIKLHKEFWPEFNIYETRWKMSREFCENFTSEQIVASSNFHTIENIPPLPDGDFLKMEPSEFLPEDQQWEKSKNHNDEEYNNKSDFEDLLYDDNVNDSDWEVDRELNYAAQTSEEEESTTIKKQRKSRVKKTTTGTKDLQCTVDPQICNRKFTELKRLNSHILNFHEGRTYLCDEEGCPQKFLSALSLRYHKKKAHGPDDSEKMICRYDDCQAKFSTYRALNAHKIQVHNHKSGLIMTVCEVCGVRVANQKLKAHLRTYHRGYKKYSCKWCPMDYTTLKELESHESLHDQVSLTTPFSCVLPDCEEVFPSSVDLTKHVINNHLTDWLECDVCGVKKRNDVLLKAHMQIHEAKKKVKGDYMCDRCPEIFLTASKLSDHKRDHHGGIKYPCNICGNKFSHKRNLVRHMGSHQTEKKFKCALCPKTFAYKQALRNHEAIHSGTKSFECQLCGKRFKQENNLRQHLSTQQHGGPPQKPRKRKKPAAKEVITEEILIIVEDATVFE